MEVKQYLEENSEYIYGFLLKLSHLSDTYAIFDALLRETRKLANAEAGSLYIVNGDKLVFSAAQNDNLFPEDAANKYIYMNSRMPINRSSIAGYVAATGRSLNIPDVNSLNPDLEYRFNNAFDLQTGYHTQSMLVVPLVNSQKKVIGVLQLINAMDDGEIVGFNNYTAHLIARIASLATIPIEKALMVINMIMRMLKTAALRDPAETGTHVQRVGNLSAELYHRWALGKNLDPDEILANKSRLRLAAMLHDIGKVGIPDGILKKPGRLTLEERNIMQTHSALGASLFMGVNNDIEEMAREITLHHHARWDGNGYTGTKERVSPAKEDIPIWARIVAIADVYDALVSKRCYKDAIDQSLAMANLQEEAGTHFDPELVTRFTEIQDVIDTIYQWHNGEKKNS